MPEFVHLHVHSHYSLLDGLGKIPEILNRVEELGMNAVALTDHGALYGLIEFWQAARKRNLKPILGVEAYLVPDRTKHRETGSGEKTIRHLTLLAENLAGYRNLLALITDAHLHGYYRKPCIDYHTLQEHATGLIALSGCLNGDLPQALLRRDREEADRLVRWHLKVFGRDRYFLELQHHPSILEQSSANEDLKTLARQYRIGLVATADAHYVRPQDAEAQDVLLCVQTGSKVTDAKRLSMLGEDYSLQSAEYFASVFRDVPEALANTRRIADRCKVELPLGTSVLPAYPVPAGWSADTYLQRLCRDGLTSRYGSAPSPTARDRLAYELSVIERTGFASYFLIVQDFVNWAKRQGIFVGPGRGSAAGSLVSYVLNITDLEPLRHELVFERFLNPERVSMPDIDLDFADDRREEVLTYVRERYGSDHVAQIITFGTLAARAAVRDTGRALGFPYTFCDRIAKLIPFGTSLRQAQEVSRELQQLAAADPQVRRLLDTAEKLEGVSRHASTHAAGVVITPMPLSEYVPLQRASANDSTIVTQYDMHAVEDLGLLKIDFLGLKNLTVLQHALRIILERTGQSLSLDTLPLDDPATYRTLQAGLTTGVFQLESAGMRRSLKELKPTEFEDIIAMVSLYRPGPMELIPDYIAGKHGLRRPSYLHPALEPILRKTYGVAVYQEQLMEIARVIAGFTLGEADVLRKAVGKKIEKLLIAQKEKFIAGAVRQGTDQKTAEKIFSFIEPFARYGFNRAHAACYALISYQTAYLKTHFPAAFMAALLTSDEHDTDRIAINVTECAAIGLKVLPPDVNESGEHFTVVPAPDSNHSPRTAEPAKEAIRFGLLAIKNVGTGVARAIIEARAAGEPFRSIHDVFRRVQTREFNKKAAESLAKSGAFDTLAERNATLQHLDTLLKLNRASHQQAVTRQAALFGDEHTAGLAGSSGLPEAPPAPADQRLRWERELLGLYLSGHPLQHVSHLLAGRTTPLKDLAAELNDYSVCVGGVVTKVQRVITRSQETMAFVTLEDQTGSVEVLVFPSVLSTDPSLWTEDAVLMVEGRVSERDGAVKVICEQASQVRDVSADAPAESPSAPATQETRLVPEVLPRPYVLLVLPLQADRDLLRELKSALSALPTGPARVYLRVPKREGTVDVVRTTYAVQLTTAGHQRLEVLLGPQAVEHAMETSVPAATTTPT